MKPTDYFGVYQHNGDLYTRNLTPGMKVYGEQLITVDGVEYRSWHPRRSKLAAAVKQSLKNYAFREGSSVLYLGAASGTTVSHISDICTAGRIFAVEISPVPGRQLVELARYRRNLFPIIADASRPESYLGRCDPVVDVLYQDVAQRDQAEIFLRNANLYLKKGGTGYLMLKTKSVDVTMPAEKVLADTVSKLENGGMHVVETVDIGRYEKEHYAIVVR